MNRFILPTLILTFGVLVLFSSCAKDEFTSSSTESVFTEQTSESFLANQGLPAIMFSYNVLDVNNNLLSSWLIDTEGNIRSSEIESDVVYEGDFLSAYYMNKKKEESVATDIKVDLDRLVNNFKRIGAVKNLDYDLTAETGDSQNLTAIYGYYYVSAANEESCGCSSEISTTDSSTTDSSSSLQMYQAVLLEQRVGDKMIQENTEASAVLAWINGLNVKTEDK